MNIRGFDDKSYDYNKFNSLPCLHFSIKHVWSLKNNPLCGICFLPWLEILQRHYLKIECKYYFRVGFITALAIFNSLLCFIETLLYSREIDSIELCDDPIFIIGHPRTGTTLVHNLLCSDEESFFFCTTFCAGFPSSFLWFEDIGKYIFSTVIEKTRPMDSMPLHFDLPQEDECATNILSGGKSYYMPLWFMQQEPLFRRYLDFSDADGGTKQDEDDWARSFLYLMKKITLRERKSNRNKTECSPRRLLIKSPVHTGRVPLLRKLFPKAKFLYIHRNPYEVLASAAHMADTAYWFCYLNTPTDEQVTEFIFWQFEALWTKYNSAAMIHADKCRQPLSSPGERYRRLMPDVLEISYFDITTRPQEVLQHMYQHIGAYSSSPCMPHVCTKRHIIFMAGLDWTSRQAAHYSDQVDQLKSYQRNRLSTLPDAIKGMVNKRWGAYFDAFGYSYE